MTGLPIWSAASKKSRCGFGDPDFTLADAPGASPVAPPDAAAVAVPPPAAPPPYEYEPIPPPTAEERYRAAQKVPAVYGGRTPAPPPVEARADYDAGGRAKAMLVRLAREQGEYILHEMLGEAVRDAYTKDGNLHLEVADERDAAFIAAKTAFFNAACPAFAVKIVHVPPPPDPYEDIVRQLKVLSGGRVTVQ
ncbi:MAG: hypothetical protein LBM78_00855 [Clostridiales bacterium]|jgi:hypothetical protein|nr:hypothetical protein [Clostridiales bacterium]